jgi:hypothetical protein
MSTAGTGAIKLPELSQQLCATLVALTFGSEPNPSRTTIQLTSPGIQVEN